MTMDPNDQRFSRLVLKELRETPDIGIDSTFLIALGSIGEPAGCVAAVVLERLFDPYRRGWPAYWPRIQSTFPPIDSQDLLLCR